MSYSKRLMVWSSEVNILLDVNNVADQNLSRFSCQLEMLTPLFIHSSFYIFFCFLYFFFMFFCFFVHFSQIRSFKPNSEHDTQLVFLSSMASGIKGK